MNYPFAKQGIYNIQEIKPNKMETKTWYYAQYELNKFPMFSSCFETLAEVEKDVKPYLSVMENLEYKKREVVIGEVEND